LAKSMPALPERQEMVTCTCGSWQDGAKHGDMMCQFQGGLNCASLKDGENTCPGNGEICSLEILEVCTCPSWQDGAKTGDIMCAFQNGMNCAGMKDGENTCPGNGKKCLLEILDIPEFPEIPEICTCTSWQDGAKSGDMMCAFQNGQNCASLREGQSTCTGNGEKCILDIPDVCVCRSASLEIGSSGGELICQSRKKRCTKMGDKKKCSRNSRKCFLPKSGRLIDAHSTDMKHPTIALVGFVAVFASVAFAKQAFNSSVKYMYVEVENERTNLVL